MLNGTVQSGLGEGAYYMSLRPYTDQFLEILGFSPFPGTLNVQLLPNSTFQRQWLSSAEWKVVQDESERPDLR